MNNIEMTQDLTRLSRKLKALIAELPTNPGTPGDFVKQAEIEAEIVEIQAQQTEIGKALLELDKAAQQRKVEQLQAKSAEGAAAAEELLEKLPAFASAAGQAFKILGDEYQELLALSQKVRSTNLALLNNRMPACCSAPVHIEPNALHRVIKQQFQESFGDEAANVFLSQQTEPFDLVAAVADIEACCAKENPDE